MVTMITVTTVTTSLGSGPSPRDRARRSTRPSSSAATGLDFGPSLRETRKAEQLFRFRPHRKGKPAPVTLEGYEIFRVFDALGLELHVVEISLDQVRDFP